MQGRHGHLSREQKQLALRLHARGWRLVDIAKEIGCSAPMVGIMARTGRHLDAKPFGWEPRAGSLKIEEREVVATPESLYGARKTWRVLRAKGIEVARCTVERVMRANEWSGTTRRRKVRTTIPAKDGVRAGDLLNREFTAPGLDSAWVADFTYVRTWAGFVYVAFVVDVFSRRIIGWHATRSKQTELVLAAMRMATWTRARSDHPIVKTIHHSDAGSQYTSVRFTERLGLEGLTPSIGSVGDAYDNALMESTIGLYKAECIDTTVFHLGAWKTLEDVEYATAEWIDWFNQRRVHSALDYATPAAVEDAYYTQAPAGEPMTVNN